MKKLAIYTALLAGLSLASTHAFAEATAYKNFYITYMSTTAVSAAVKYAKTQGVNHIFMWTVNGDEPIESSKSLIRAINVANPDAVVSTYYPNYAVYNNSKQRALPGKSYKIKDNKDLNGKLQQSNQLIYAFAETQVPSSADDPNARFTKTPGSYGAVYFYDPWSDLAAGDTFCGGDVPKSAPKDAAGYNLICGYAFDTKKKPNTNDYDQYNTTSEFNNYGNLSAFAALSVDGKDHQPIQKYLSIGGFGHNATFEAIFDPSAYGITDITQSQAMDNFVNSVVLILQNYHLDGVDMDYENVTMTHQQSEDYYTLLQKLNERLALLDKHISIPTISNPHYLDGTEQNSTVDFAPGVLKKIAALSQVTYIDPMTYDFSGTFNYHNSQDPGTTGFLTNTYNPTDQNMPKGYIFSIENVLATLKKLDIPMNKVGIGIPAYGRALANLPASTTDNSYLFSTLNDQVVIPAGDEDVAKCSQNIANWQSPSSCQGMFSYHYIIDHIINKDGVQTTDHTDDTQGLTNGTTAFGATWKPAPPPPWTLTIINHNKLSGQVAVGDFKTPNWIHTGTAIFKPEDNPSLAAIEGEKGLTATFTYWNGTIQCGKVDMTHNVTVTISSAATPTCQVS